MWYSHCRTHTRAHTHAQSYTHSVHTRVQCSGALKLEPYRQPWLELPTRLVNRYIFFLLATLSFHLSVSLYLPLSPSSSLLLPLSAVEIEPCPCPELVRASAAAQSSASFPHFLSEIFCYFIFLLFMFIVIYLAVKKRKLFHTFESSGGGKGVLGIYIICWLVFFTINWVKFNNQTLNWRLYLYLASLEWRLRVFIKIVCLLMDLALLSIVRAKESHWHTFGARLVKLLEFWGVGADAMTENCSTSVHKRFAVLLIDLLI